MAFESPAAASSLPPGENVTARTGLTRPEADLATGNREHEFTGLTWQRVKKASCVVVENVDASILMPRCCESPVYGLEDSQTLYTERWIQSVQDLYTSQSSP